MTRFPSLSALSCKAKLALANSVFTCSKLRASSSNASFLSVPVGRVLIYYITLFKSLLIVERSYGFRFVKTDVAIYYACYKSALAGLNSLSYPIF